MIGQGSMLSLLPWLVLAGRLITIIRACSALGFRAVPEEEVGLYSALSYKGHRPRIENCITLARDPMLRGRAQELNIAAFIIKIGFRGTNTKSRIRKTKK